MLCSEESGFTRIHEKKRPGKKRGQPSGRNYQQELEGDAIGEINQRSKAREANQVMDPNLVIRCESAQLTSDPAPADLIAPVGSQPTPVCHRLQPVVTQAE